MDALFVELPAFERYRSQYLDDADFRSLQQLLLLYPHVGDVIRGTGGLRKMRFANALRHAGKRGGIRIITTGGPPGGSSGSSRCTQRPSRTT
ncbi:hypothetical protein [Pseudomonas xantholysinigenes]|uniref:hypothetical protein n=1 Tax=Pseudomonas xantholysinigenes TaxID=2745490 RepID=UPI003F5A91F8